MVIPSKGHLEQFYYIFAFLKNKQNSYIVFDTSEPNIDGDIFGGQDWSNTIYGYWSEKIPSNATYRRGYG